MLSGGYGGEAPLLVGPEARDFRRIAEIASDIVRHPITRRVISGEAYQQALVATGFPVVVARSLATGFASRAAGELAIVDSTLSEIVGRPLRTVAEVLPSLLAKAARV
jgi:hypothetical protein